MAMQENSGLMPESIDALANRAEALRVRLKGGDRITSRELRMIWSGRLRPFWRLHIDIYRAISRRFLDQGDNYLASEAADEGGEFFGDDVALILTRALAAARSGSPQSAQALLARKHLVLEGAEEAKSLLARTYKDLWKSSGDPKYLEQAFELYHADFTTTKGDRSFPGVNAASMALFLGRVDEARRIAGEVLEILRARPDTSGYWDLATIAECQLVRGDIETARASYARAAGGGQVAHAHLATTRAQARLLLRQLGCEESGFDRCFPLPGVLAFTGHRIDEPGRKVPRFPEELAPAIKESIRGAVAKSGAGFGYSAAANGSDILFLECLQEAGLETYVHLPLPEEDFIRASVLGASSGWLDRFRAVAANATEFTCAHHAEGGALDFDYGNRLMLGAARQRARQLGSELCLLAVWDGISAQPGSGGTADFVRLARESDCAVEVISLPGCPRFPAPEPGPVEPAEQLLSILSLSLLPGPDAERQLASAASGAGAIHQETASSRVRLCFSTPGEAARAACLIRRELPGSLQGAIGLHAGPARITRHPVTGESVIRGEHASKSDELSDLSPGGLVYASSAFIALLSLPAQVGARSEFLGYRALCAGAAREPVFQVLG